MLTQPASDTRMKTLEATHISFIDNHTKEGAKTAWDQTAYSTETAAILGQYHSAEASESQFCPSRLALVKQAEALVTVDINLISKTHGVSNGYATRQKKQVSAFYDGSSAP